MTGPAGMLVALSAVAIVGCGGASDDELLGSGGGGSTSTGGLGGAGGISGSSGTGGSGAGGGASGAGGIGGSGGGECDLGGAWATSIEVGVEWQSGTIKPGAGTVRQWLLSTRTIAEGKAIDEGHVCGARSPHFATILNAWVGVDFLDALFDQGALPVAKLVSALQMGSPGRAQPGDGFETEKSPFLLGVEGMGTEEPWPTVAGIQSFLVDHDLDGNAGITAAPRKGQVAGEPPGTEYNDPQLDLTGLGARANPLFMAIRTQGALQGELVSCDPPRVEGTVVPSTLRIDLRSLGCRIAGGGQACSPQQNQFLDDNMPRFVPNGTSRVVSVRVPPQTTCAEVRAMSF